jgi:phosphoribosyl-ATP pyrophosphohydrolase
LEAKEQLSKIDLLLILVQELHDNGALHKKRGFSLHDSTPELAANHMIEEAVELQAEATIARNRDGVVEESADVLATWLHLLIHCDVSFEEVVVRCMEKLRDTFTLDKDQVLTDTPGFTRRNRQDDKELHSLFHQLWTANVGQDGYDKQKWQKLADKLRSMTGVELT